MILRKAMWKKGYRYRKNYSELSGCPDIVLTRYKIAIFCDGEFFHGKDWEALRHIGLIKLLKIRNVMMRSIKSLFLWDGMCFDFGEGI